MIMAIFPVTSLTSPWVPPSSAVATVAMMVPMCMEPLTAAGRSRVLQAADALIGCEPFPGPGPHTLDLQRGELRYVRGHAYSAVASHTCAEIAAC